MIVQARRHGRLQELNHLRQLASPPTPARYGCRTGGAPFQFPSRFKVVSGWWLVVRTSYSPTGACLPWQNMKTAVANLLEAQLPMKVVRILFWMGSTAWLAACGGEVAMAVSS